MTTVDRRREAAGHVAGRATPDRIADGHGSDDADRDRPRGAGSDSGGSSSLADLAATCVAVLGPDLAAYVSGARTPEELASLTGARSTAGPGALSPRLIRERLGAALEVIDAFAAANRVGMVRAWLREIGAAGPGSAPAAVLRHSREHGARKRVHEAAERFLTRRLPAT